LEIEEEGFERGKEKKGGKKVHDCILSCLRQKNKRTKGGTRKKGERRKKLALVFSSNSRTPRAEKGKGKRGGYGEEEGKKQAVQPFVLFILRDKREKG